MALDVESVAKAEELRAQRHALRLVEQRQCRVAHAEAARPATVLAPREIDVEQPLLALTIGRLRVQRTVCRRRGRTALRVQQRTQGAGRSGETGGRGVARRTAAAASSSLTRSKAIRPQQRQLSAVSSERRAPRARHSRE